MALLKTLRHRLGYRHKWSTARYLLGHPYLIPLMVRRRAPAHLFRSMGRFLDSAYIDSVHYFLPEKFTNALNEKGVYDNVGYRLLLYLLVRKYKPEVFVETGVARGLSSSYVLQAMEENGKGKLYSIDLAPEQAEVAPSDTDQSHRLSDGQVHEHYEVGYVVPDYLRHRWSFHPGDSKVVLPKLLEDLGQIDAFYHDSLHVYEHMKFEYETAWPYIRPGGMLTSHDVTWNPAFAELCRKHGLKSEIYRTFGYVRKRA